MTNFVDFHTRSAFSFLEAASLPEDLVQRAADLGHSAMALMDRDNLCGAPRFYMAAKKIGAKAHIGAEITGEDGDLYPLLVENRTGYQNLCRLITSMKLRAPKGEAAASQEELYRFSSGLVCLTGEGSAHSPTFRQTHQPVRTRQRLCRASASLPSRSGSAQSSRDRAGAIHAACRCSRPTACATPLPRNASWPTCSPRSATRPRSWRRGSCWRAMPSAISNRRR